MYVIVTRLFQENNGMQQFLFGEIFLRNWKIVFAYKFQIITHLFGQKINTRLLEGGGFCISLSGTWLCDGINKVFNYQQQIRIHITRFFLG